MIDAIQRFWEDQHPVVRSHFSMGLGLLALIAVLHLGLRSLGGVFDPQRLFQFEMLLQLFRTLLLLMLVLMGFNLLKVALATLRRQDVFVPRSIALTLAGILLFVGGIVWMPSVFEQAIAHQVGVSYNTAYEDFRATCDQIYEATEAADEIVYDESELDFGVLSETVDTFRVRATIIFNVGDDDALDFGWACALQGEAPSDAARARNYEYERIQGRYYRFVERDPDAAF